MKTNDYAGARLCRLKGSDYEVADGQPDIRGWDVKDVNGKTIGEIDDLIFDEQSLKVRYMVVDLDDNDFDLDDDRDVLIPIGLGEIPEKDDVVIVPNITAAQLAALPEYDKDETITPQYEYNIRNVFAGAGAVSAGAASTDIINDDFYNHEYFNEDNLNRRRKSKYANTGDTTIDTARDTTRDKVTDTTDTYSTTTDTYSTNVTDRNQQSTTIPVIEENVEIGKQQVKTGGAYIKARIVEKPIEETVNLKEEHLNIDRKPVDRPANSTDFDTFKEGVIEMEERAEIPVVNKEARVVEEININKEVSERTETVRDTVRKTEVDIENLGNKADTYRNND
ncbi:DUF2382 domain-containing protein [Ilyomonas limi]|uniref:DUF2382 domain-containing protein n=1 Tax=Ilyomonas limi TaxID=2575867 RepID=A0A4U3L3Y5_9BACT|nr:DUF2382 domain-containing protein [Ilyomonas limi]TKK69024.1 DUF2382 domain-containing protein [Ilyomonas limi]